MRYDVNKGVTRRDWTTIILIWIAVAGVSFGVFAKVNQWKLERQMESTVYQVCQWTRMSNDSEVACGHAQDYSHLRYTCEQKSKSPDNKCEVSK